MKKLTDLPNIGEKVAKILVKVGINSPEELKKIGSIATCKRLNAIGEFCYSKLYALEGAICGLRWHNLPKDYLKKN